MVGQLKFSPQEYLIDRWDDEKWRKPFLFSAGIHLAILLIALFPSSLFHFSRNIPEVYTVDLIDVNDLPLMPPEEYQESFREETASPADQTQSLQPLLSTRTIPKAPTEIKLIRPRALKKDVRLPPMDPTMVLAALNRIQQQEKANEEKQKALEAIRKSILAREAAEKTGLQETSNEGKVASVSEQKAGNQSAAAGQAGRGQAADTALKKYKALTSQHISRFWILPEGQVWRKDLYATVLVKIRPEGFVVSTELEKPSDSAQFDKFVLQTIEQASPLPPLPEDIPNVPLRLHFYPEGMM
jgi:TonB family protein